MRILVTGSSGHLGEALVRVLRADGHEVTGLDVLPSDTTTVVGSVTDHAAVRAALRNAEAVLHTATLHKPHVASHPRQAFIDTNVTGTLTLLEESVAAGVGRFVFTSTTSAFGRALTPDFGEPATWITEDVPPIPRNIYGASKVAAESLCELVHRDHGLPCLILRTSRFFPEPDDSADVRGAYSTANVQANEMLYRRVDLADVVGARYAARHWRMFPHIDRVYVNAKARAELGWQPKYDFAKVLQRLSAGEEPRSELAVAVGAKGYHSVSTGPYTTR